MLGRGSWRRATHDNLSQRRAREGYTAAVILWLVRNTRLVIRMTHTHPSCASGLHPWLLAHRSRDPRSFLRASSNSSIFYDIQSHLRFLIPWLPLILEGGEKQPPAPSPPEVGRGHQRCGHFPREPLGAPSPGRAFINDQLGGPGPWAAG